MLDIPATVEMISVGQLYLRSQGDVKEAQFCPSEALLTADLCVFSHLSCCVREGAHVRVSLERRCGCWHATGRIGACACRGGDGAAFVAALHE